MKKLFKFLKDEEGIVAIEYALIGFFVAVTIVAIVTTLGTTLVGVFSKIVAAID